MRRTGPVLAALAMALPFGFSAGALVTAPGCSGSSGTIGPAERNEEADKVGQDKMKEYMAKKGPAKGQKKK
jgi:hypothetical protein